jgi:DNA-binding MarR family transcriptional regulator
MESKGLVERWAHESDRRAVNVRLSEAGRELTPKIAEISVAENQRFVGALTDDEGREFLRLLKKLVGSLDG